MTHRQTVVVLTGAGISAESGLRTFRDSDGLWEGHRVEDVATPHAWRRDPATVLKFYNERRAALALAAPNRGHLALVELERKFDVRIVTQNVDNLHEQAGSSSVLHLHGELTKARSDTDPSYIVDIGVDPIELGQCCPNGGQLRPHIVWFGEEVPAMTEAIEITARADILLIVGTSLVVYPAAGLVSYAPTRTRVYVVDPRRPTISASTHTLFIEKSATEGVPQVVAELLAQPGL